MARVTVEDCVLEVPNRFELVALASRRAKDIASGNSLTVDRDNDKDAVVALREIAEKTVSVSTLREEVVLNLQKRIKQDVIEEDTPEADDATDKTEVVAASTEDEITKEVESLGIAEPTGGFSFSEDNLDVED